MIRMRKSRYKYVFTYHYNIGQDKKCFNRKLTEDTNVIVYKKIQNLFDFRVINVLNNGNTSEVENRYFDCYYHQHHYRFICNIYIYIYIICIYSMVLAV